MRPDLEEDVAVADPALARTAIRLAKQRIIAF